MSAQGEAWLPSAEARDDFLRRLDSYIAHEKIGYLYEMLQEARLYVVAAPTSGQTHEASDPLIRRLVSASYSFPDHISSDGMGWVKVRHADMTQVIDRLRAAPSPAAAVAEGAYCENCSNYLGRPSSCLRAHQAPSGPADARVRAAEQAVVTHALNWFGLCERKGDALSEAWCLGDLVELKDACAALAALRSGGSA